MAWPLSQDYNEAIQSPKSNFADPALRRGEAVCNALGIPMPYSGNFADVYQVRCPDGSRWAVKCFTREALGLRDRYQEISAHLQKAKLPFTVDFTYLEQGIRVAGAWYPVLKMQWVEGLTLNQFVSQYLDKPAMLEALFQMWGRMGQYLRAAEVGHCDLQHGNVLLAPGASANSLALKLIDYDGMWVPALAGKKSGEVGHPSYQHPQRLQEGTYSLEVDRFPLLLVAASLRALKLNGKGLWEKYDNGDNLLFKESDLRDPGASALFRELPQIGDPLTGMLTTHMLKALKLGMESTPLLEEATPDAKAAATPAPPRSSRTAATAAPKTAAAVAPAVAGVARVAAQAPAQDETFAFEDSGAAAAGTSSTGLKRAKPKAKGKAVGVPRWLWIAGAASAVVLIGVAALAVSLATGKVADNAPHPSGPPVVKNMAAQQGPAASSANDSSGEPKRPIPPPVHMPSPTELGLPVTNGLELWLDANSLNDRRKAKGEEELSDGDKVSVWYDLSGNGRDLTQDFPDCRPTFLASQGGVPPSCSTDRISISGETG